MRCLIQRSKPIPHLAAWLSMSPVFLKNKRIRKKRSKDQRKIALDDAGNWSKAAQGFVRGQGLTTDDITFRKLRC